METSRPVSKYKLGTCKLPWGTILKPNFEMGHQKLPEEEVERIVKRLIKSPEPKQIPIDRRNKDMTQEEIQAMLDRLTDPKNKYYRIPDYDRRVAKSMYSDMGVVSSYAWKGYN